MWKEWALPPWGPRHRWTQTSRPFIGSGESGSAWAGGGHESRRLCWRDIGAVGQAEWEVTCCLVVRRYFQIQMLFYILVYLAKHNFQAQAILLENSTKITKKKSSKSIQSRPESRRWRKECFPIHFTNWASLWYKSNRKNIYRQVFLMNLDIKIINKILAIESSNKKQ